MHAASARLRSRLAPRPADDKQAGFTLVEMTVVVGILGMILAMVMGMMISITKSVGGDLVRVDQTAQSKVAIESMTKSLRTAVLPKQLSATCSGCDVAAFISGNVRSVQFYANLDNDYTAVPAGTTTNGPSKVTYTVGTDGVLTETIRRPNAHVATDFNYQYTCVVGTTGCAVYSRIIARGVSTTQNAFTYYDRNGALLTPPLAGDDLASVDSVDITLKVQTAPGIPATNTVTRVTLPNAGVVPEATASP